MVHTTTGIYTSWVFVHPFEKIYARPPKRVENQASDYGHMLHMEHLPA